MTQISSSDWDDVLGYVRVNHPELIRGWFAQLEPTGLAGGVLHVRAGNPLQVRYLEDHCRSVFSSAAQATFGQLISAAFETNGSVESADANGYPLSFADEDLTLNDHYTFQHFVCGPSNRLAHAACVAVAESPGLTYNPLFVHGDVGLGKTHLLQAICHGTQANGACPNMLYISCETFINHFLEAVERGAMTQFRYRYRHVDLLVIDDIQFLAERERSQEEFFHTFNTLHQSQKQIVLSADCSPAEIPSLENRLISRFNSGLVACIDMPCLETRMAILRSKARLRCIELPEDVIKFVASRIESNIRDVEGALVRLDAHAQTGNGVIDLDLAREVFGDEPVAGAITLPDIVGVVTRHFGVRLADLQSKKRTKSVSNPRQICMYLTRELTNHSLQEVGGFFGGRDHTTVLHAIRTIKALRRVDASADALLKELTAALTRGRSI